ncbi:hypothetical protein GQ54DRAFT_255649 [Martensiomyces pterosporus]|nr:hypothetical protein GQ54DRAFT_255649 [Martensiomyces pterosporus]
MDTNWCTFCGQHIDGSDDALYCSETCRHSDGNTSAPTTPSPSEYFSLASPRASPVSSPTWSPQGLFRDRSPSLTPMTPVDLSSRLPCHTPAYSSSRSSVVYQSPLLGPSALDANASARGRATSLPSTHQLSAM